MWAILYNILFNSTDSSSSAEKKSSNQDDDDDSRYEYDYDGNVYLKQPPRSRDAKDAEASSHRRSNQQRNDVIYRRQGDDSRRRDERTQRGRSDEQGYEAGSDYSRPDLDRGSNERRGNVYNAAASSKDHDASYPPSDTFPPHLGTASFCGSG